MAEHKDATMKQGSAEFFTFENSIISRLRDPGAGGSLVFEDRGQGDSTPSAVESNTQRRLCGLPEILNIADTLVILSPEEVFFAYACLVAHSGPGGIMADCECLPKCPFFHDKMADRPATAEMMKKEYCQGNSEKCARHMVKAAAGSEHVPANLFPHQTQKVPEILAALATG
jgi:hypothetical protein